MTLSQRHTSRYWTAFISPEEAQQSARAAYSTVNRERGVLDAALAILAEQLGGDATPITTLSNGILRIQLRDPNGIRFSLAAWPTDEPLSQYFETLIVDDARESLCICLVPTRTANVSRIAEHAFIFYPADMDALANNDVTVWQLLDYKSVRRFLQGRTPIETMYARERLDNTSTIAIDDYFPDAQEVLSLQQDWIEHPLRDELDAELRRGRWTLLVGNSSSGKTILAMQAAVYLRLAGYNIRWLNVGTHGEPPATVLSALAHQKTLRGAIFVIDDLQSSPGAARYVVSILRLLQRVAQESAPTLLGISWLAFARDVLHHESDWRPLAVTADVIREGLLERFQETLAFPKVRETLELLGDDLLLIRLFLERTRTAGRAVSAEELANFLFERRTNDEQRTDGSALKATVVAGTLGEFDIAPREAFVRAVADLSVDRVGSLVKGGLLRRQSDTITIGHRSLSGLLADWATAQNAWSQLPDTAPRGASELVLAYLRSLESTRALDTLSALTARARFRERQKLNPRAALIIEIWHAFLAVVERIEHQQQADPTWGGDPSSAMFAAQALARIGKTESAMRSIDFLRTRWRIIDQALQIDLTAFSTHRDFKQIIERMRDEDASLGRAAKYPAGTIDKDRFHQTWLSGVILCAEAAASRPHAEVQHLIAAIEHEIEPNGNFYPARVPWCSARVLLGLAGLGRNVHNSETVQRCVAWLTRDEKNDGARHAAGIWRGGTGTWNSDLETTALVLLALMAVGHDPASERLARQFLLSERPQWTAAGKELDGAVALHAYVETGGSFSEVAESARQLSIWARSEALWLSATDRSEFDQSCRVAQIAAHLVNIGWTAIRTNLPVFLEALEPRTPFLFQAETLPRLPAVPPATTPAGLRPPDTIVTALGTITTIDLDEYTVVGGYRRHDERVRHRLLDRVEEIRNALTTKSTVRENFLIWAAPGSGKSYLVQETARMMGDAITYHELNLAKMSHDEFSAALAAIPKDRPILCCLDEFDARETETWPYEEVFPLFDWNITGVQSVFVAIGSCPDGLHALERLILGRKKGKDLLDRTPVDKRFEIPVTSIEDKVIILASKLREAAQEREQKLDYIDKLAVYYALTIPELQTPRQLRDLIFAAVARTNIGDTRLRYDHLFQRGDHRNHKFWAEHIDIAEALAERFIHVVGSPT